MWPEAELLSKRLVTFILLLGQASGLPWPATEQVWDARKAQKASQLAALVWLQESELILQVKVSIKMMFGKEQDVFARSNNMVS